MNEQDVILQLRKQKRQRNAAVLLLLISLIFQWNPRNLFQTFQYDPGDKIDLAMAQSYYANLDTTRGRIPVQDFSEVLYVEFDEIFAGLLEAHDSGGTAQNSGPFRCTRRESSCWISLH